MRLRQYRIIVPAERLMKELESSKHKITHVYMQRKAPFFQKAPCGAKEGRKSHLFGGARCFNHENELE
jgi:hypothetical protein